MKRLLYQTPLLVCLASLITHSSFVQGFQAKPPKSARILSCRTVPRPDQRHHTITTLRSSNDNEYDMKAASVKLVWEQLQESSSKPILNLSSRNESPEEAEAAAQKAELQNCKVWSKGQYWKQTLDGLHRLGVAEADDSFLEKCPQLLRLDPEMVLETAEWIITEFSVHYLKSEPRLLSYPSVNVKYGLEFMSTMMMTDAKPACLASPDFFFSAIDGGIQEQSIKKALGAAGDATSKATQTIAGDAMTSLKNLKNRKGLS